LTLLTGMASCLQETCATYPQKNLATCRTDGRLLLSGFQLLVTLTLDWVIWHMIVHHSSDKVFVDGHMDGCTYWRTDISPSNVIRSTRRSRPKNPCHLFQKILFQNKYGRKTKMEPVKTMLIWKS